MYNYTVYSFTTYPHNNVQYGQFGCINWYFWLGIPTLSTDLKGIIKLSTCYNLLTYEYYTFMQSGYVTNMLQYFIVILFTSMIYLSQGMLFISLIL